MTYTWPGVLRGVQAVDNGDGGNLPGATAGEGGMPKERSGGRGRVATDAPSEPECCGPGGPGWGPLPRHPQEAQTYRFSFPKRLLRLRCPVAGYQRGVLNQTNLRVHFAHHYTRDTIVIME